jgi:hypothetical protein
MTYTRTMFNKNVYNIQNPQPEAAFNSGDKHRDKFLERLYEERTYSYTEFDKGLTYISSGMMGVSFAFIDKIVKLEASIEGDLLMAGWLILCIAIVLSVINHYLNLHLINKQIVKFRSLKKATNKLSVKFKNTTIQKLNIINVILIIHGSIFIIFFIFINLKYGNRTALPGRTTGVIQGTASHSNESTKYHKENTFRF